MSSPSAATVPEDSSRMTPHERRASLSLASLYAFRMLGLFLVLPVFAVHAQHLPGGSDPLLIGLVLGIYSLTQGLLQLPFGMASDRFGRKPVIVFGLVLFALGSLVAAAATSFGCVQDSVAPADPARALEGGGGQPAVFHVRDSGFVHLGIGRSVTLRVASATGGHPLRSSARELVPASWTSRDTAVAVVQEGEVRGRAEGLTWLVWSQSAVLDSVPLVVSPAPVAYVEPRQLRVDLGAAAVPIQPPSGDSLLFCTNPPQSSGVELSGTIGVRATQPARLALRCRTNRGAIAAFVLTFRGRGR